MKPKRFVGIAIMAIVMLLLIGCAEDPRQAADAQVTIWKGQSASQAAAQALAVKQAQDAINLDQQNKMSQTWVTMANIWMNFTWWSITVTSVFVVAGAGGATVWAVIGIGRGVHMAAIQRAYWVPFDAINGQFPAINNGKFLTDINTGINMRLDTAQERDELMVRAASAQRILAIMATNTRRSNKSVADAVASIGVEPLLIDEVKYGKR